MFVCCFLYSAAANAQAGFRNWSSLNLNVPLSSKVDLRAGHLRSYNFSGKVRNDFHQTSFRAAFAATPRLTLYAGDMITVSTRSGRSRNRLFIRGAYRSRLGRYASWTNSLQLEHNSANESRFRQRIILTTRVGSRKRLDFLRMSPYVSYALYYNLGGNPVRYFDEKNRQANRQTPDGFHRGRFTAGFNSKISPRFRAGLYYLNQHEFNLLVSDERKMNVLNPRTGKIQRPFDNYHVLGISLNIMLGKGKGDKPLLTR